MNFKYLYVLILFLINGCISQNHNDTEKVIEKFDKYSLSFEPQYLDLDKSLNDSVKSLIDCLNFNDTVILRKVSNSIDLILLKECLYQFKTADLEYDLMTRESSYSKRLLFGFLTINGIDSNKIIEKSKRNLGFTTGDVYDLIKKRNSGSTTKEIKENLILINKEIERINNFQ